MPDISEDEDDNRITIYKKEIEELKNQLLSAHREIEILSLENSKLKQSNDDL